ncbi:MAG: omptin family outer membrane protease [Treponema sp.]|nr:omptin family outer membrane protease [Treponema sp.]
MRNIHLFLFLIISIFFINANNHVFSQDNKQNEDKYRFSLGIQSGIVYGQSRELVYPTVTKGKYLSELTWEMKPVFYLGLQTDFNRTNLMNKPGFFASAAFKFGIPGDTGVIEDCDWHSTENNLLTDFSSHTNRTREYYWADILIGASIPVKSYFYIKPFLSASLMHFAFTGRDGYGIYTVNNSLKYDTFEGEIIKYKQDWFLLAAGFSIGSNILSPFLFELFFQISPLTYCAAKDEHLHPEKIVTYADYSLWGLFMEPKLKISYKIKKIDLSFEAAYRYISDTNGQSYSDNGNYGIFLPSGKAGASLSLLDVRFYFKIIF